MPSQMLYLISGLGGGNATRAIAVIDELLDHKQNVAITLCSWGSGYHFLRERYSSEGRISLVKLKPYSISSGFALAANLKNYIRNSLTLVRLARSLRPDLVLCDSDYHFFVLPWCRQRIFLGQAIDVLRRSFRYRIAPSSLAMLWDGLSRELIDACYQLLLFDFIAVPSFDGYSHTSHWGKIIYTRLPVRSEFINHASFPRHFSLTYISSASDLFQTSFLDTATRTNATPLISGRRLCRREDWEGHSHVLTQCGLSTLAEALAIGVVPICMPMPNHFEQHVNSQTLARMGYGQLWPVYSHDLKSSHSRYTARVEQQDLVSSGKEIARFLADKLEASTIDEANCKHTLL